MRITDQNLPDRQMIQQAPLTGNCPTVNLKVKTTTTGSLHGKLAASAERAKDYGKCSGISNWLKCFVWDCVLQSEWKAEQNTPTDGLFVDERGMRWRAI